MPICKPCFRLGSGVLRLVVHRLTSMWRGLRGGFLGTLTPTGATVSEMHSAIMQMQCRWGRRAKEGQE